MSPCAQAAIPLHSVVLGGNPAKPLQAEGSSLSLALDKANSGQSQAYGTLEVPVAYLYWALSSFNDTDPSQEVASKRDHESPIWASPELPILTEEGDPRGE